MESIKKVLEERRNWLLKVRRDKEKALKNVPEGHLRICKRGNRIQYYHRTDPKDFNGVYIPKKNIGMVQKLHKRITMKEFG